MRERLRTEIDSMPAELDEVERRLADEALELEMPEFVAAAGRKVLDAGQKGIYGGLFQVKVTGREAAISSGGLARVTSLISKYSTISSRLKTSWSPCDQPSLTR